MKVKDIIKGLEELRNSQLSTLISPKILKTISEAITVLQDEEDFLNNFRAYREE